MGKPGGIYGGMKLPSAMQDPNSLNLLKKRKVKPLLKGMLLTLGYHFKIGLLLEVDHAYLKDACYRKLILANRNN